MTELHQDEGSAGLDTAPTGSSDLAIIEQLNALKSKIGEVHRELQRNMSMKMRHLLFKIRL